MPERDTHSFDTEDPYHNPQGEIPLPGVPVASRLRLPNLRPPIFNRHGETVVEGNLDDPRVMDEINRETQDPHIQDLLHSEDKHTSIHWKIGEATMLTTIMGVAGAAVAVELFIRHGQDLKTLVNHLHNTDENT